MFRHTCHPSEPLIQSTGLTDIMHSKYNCCMIPCKHTTMWENWALTCPMLAACRHGMFTVHVQYPTSSPTTASAPRMSCPAHSNTHTMDSLQATGMLFNKSGYHSVTKVIIVSGSGLMPIWCQAITWTKDDSFSIRHQEKCQWKWNWKNNNIYIRKCRSENVFSKLRAIMFRPQYINHKY